MHTQHIYTLTHLTQSKVSARCNTILIYAVCRWQSATATAKVTYDVGDVIIPVGSSWSLVVQKLLSAAVAETQFPLGIQLER